MKKIKKGTRVIITGGILATHGQYGTVVRNNRSGTVEVRLDGKKRTLKYLPMNLEECLGRHVTMEKTPLREETPEERETRMYPQDEKGIVKYRCAQCEKIVPINDNGEEVVCGDCIGTPKMTRCVEVDDLYQSIVSTPLLLEPKEAVDHPDHYNAHPSGVECIDVVEHMSFNIGNAVKYLWRLDEKHDDGGKEDLKKAIWYLNREMKKRDFDE